MKKYLRINILFFLIFSTGLAEESNSTSKKVSVLKKSYTSLSTSYLFWQEKMDVISNRTLGTMLMQFQGFKISYSYNKPFQNARWLHSYSGDFAFGNIKGSSLTTSITDELKDQSWTSFTASVGAIYRTSSASEILLSLPVSYKKPIWKLSSPLELDDHPFSLGISGTFTARLNLHSSLSTSLTHQQMWGATIWSIGYQYDFRKK